MMKCYTRIITLCATVLLGGCGYSIDPLDNSDLERWLRAYKNIASGSPTLLEQKRASGADTLLGCSACRSTLEDQVVKAGYPNLRTFLVIDTRIRVAQADVLHRKMTNLLASLDQEVKTEARKSCVPSSSSDTKQQMVENGMALICWMLATKVEQMKKTSETEDAIISKVTIESDVDFVSKNFATVDRASSDQRLIEDYRNNLSPEEKNSPDPHRIQACKRLELGLGDAQDKARCPNIKTALNRSGSHGAG